ncbi:hypothetical protein EGW08_009435 [Elysia chlorotica]|uniref:TBC1 domain family member 23 n=1 Tax=Elysia chlorotica TaxID=188477 RepID=A0A3S1HN94_ELYCH|nr:hypothetical protein EGW08_009435 [Elysia chlorotica]
MADTNIDTELDLDGLDLTGVLDEDDSSWLAELETALVEECDFGSLRNICKGRAVPDHLRAEVWQICLGTVGKDALSSFDGLYDMEGQSQVRSDCKALVDKLGNEEEDKVSIVSDLETIVTLYCKSRGLKYTSSNGWMDVLQVLLTVKMSPSELYNTFYAILNKFVPKSLNKFGLKLSTLFIRCSTPGPPRPSGFTARVFRMWFNSVFGGVCGLKVCQVMWDVIFQHADPFLEFFMGLVILVNASLTYCRKGVRLEVEDVEDFCSLAQYYAQKTPQSFRRDYQLSMFGGSVVSHKEPEDSTSLMYSLCLSVSGEELLQANKGTPLEDAVRFFVVDCRPAEQYNNEHLTTAFHLDANLMLQSPEEFSYAVQALFAAQAQALAAGSAAAGEHLCFLGSGREEEDQYVNMVVANILQKGKQYVSTAKGGYPGTEGLFGDASFLLIYGICIVFFQSCSFHVLFLANVSLLQFSKAILGRLSGVVKSKSAEMKEKLANYIKNDGTGDKHVSSAERGGKRYRNMANVFTIGDDEEGDDGSGAESEEDDAQKETVSLDTWVQKADVLYSCRCKEIRSNGHSFPSYLLVTSSHLYVLREIPSRKGMAHIQARRALSSIVKITSKKRQPELITFKYGTHEEDGFHVTDMHRFYIPTASDSTRVIKQSKHVKYI